MDRGNESFRPVVPEATLDAMVKRIVDRFRPVLVLLFGSHAMGFAGPDSDVDLLVVMPLNGRRLDAALDIRRELRGFGVAKDIIVLTPEEFSVQKDVPGTVAYPAAHEGRVLYAA